MAQNYIGPLISSPIRAGAALSAGQVTAYPYESFKSEWNRRLLPLFNNRQQSLVKRLNMQNLRQTFASWPLSS